MARVTETPAVVLTLFILGITTSFSHAEREPTRCFRCDHNEVSNNNNAVVKWVLQTLSKVDHPACKLEDVNNDKYNVDVVECPPVADDGQTFVCGTARGSVTTSFSGVSFQLDTVARDCVQVRDDGSYSGCREEDTISGPLRYLLEEAISVVDDVDLDTFQGSQCYNKGSPAIPNRDDQLRCVTCSRNELVSDNVVLKPVFELFSQISDDACLLENRDDAYRVGSRLCPDPSRGQRAVCGVIKGEASTSFLGVTFTYKTMERGCIEQPAAESLVGECTTEVPSTGSFKNLVKQGLQSLSLGDVQFDGFVCYSNTGFGMVTDQGALVGRTAHARPVSVWALVGLSLCCMVLAALV